MGDDLDSTGDVLEQLLLESLQVQDGELESNGIGKLKLI
jgi:hypothetical protein